MKAFVRDRYCSPEKLEVKEVAKPELADDGVLVRVRATSLNRGDWYTTVGAPLVGRPMMGLLKPRSPLIGGDFAGVVEAVGKDVTDFEPGDEVFGGRTGAFAEYVCSRLGLARKPANLSFEEAAAVPIAAITALQALRDHGRVQPGEKVLINGASGGVGTFAVQIAKALGAEVTAVCSTRNVETARTIGADRVVDYTKEDFTRSDERYDLYFDNAGNRPWREVKRVLKPNGRIVLVGGQSRSRLLGPLGHTFRFVLLGRLTRRRVTFFIAKLNKADMSFLRELAEDGKIAPVIDRRYAFGELRDALQYMGEGHAQGKIVVTL